MSYRKMIIRPAIDLKTGLSKEVDDAAWSRIHSVVSALLCHEENIELDTIYEETQSIASMGASDDRKAPNALTRKKNK